MRDFNEFCDYLKDHVKDYLPDEFKDAEVNIGPVRKNNGTELMGLSIRTQSCTISPNIYLDNYYKEYKAGMDIDLACERIANTHIEHMNPGNDLSGIVDKFQDTEFIKSHVVVNLVNAQKNEALLKEVPHRLKEDLAIVYRVYLGNEGESMGTVLVKNEHMKVWGISEDTLYECAMKNSNDLMPVEVQDIGSVLAGMGLGVPFPDDNMGPQLYVISNRQKCNGAAGILYSDCLEKLSQKLGSDLFILPSSVHETLALSAENSEVQTLAEMVREINATQVSPEEQLSDHVYKYDAKAKTFSLADVSAKDLEMSKVSENGASYEAGESSRPRRHR